MENQKKWFKSKTIWLSIIACVLKIANPILIEHNINIPDGIVELILGGAVINGRISNKPITRIKKTS